MNNMIENRTRAIISIHDYLTDEEFKPIPVPALIDYPNIYLKQLIECATYWTPNARLAVGSLIVGQPLKAQGASDVSFIYSEKMPLGDPDDEKQIPTVYVPLNLDGNSFLCVEILGAWGGTIADVNDPAEKAAERAKGRGINIDESWPILYGFVRQVASHGWYLNLNELNRQGVITNEGHRILLKAEGILKNQAVEALNAFEGRDVALKWNDLTEKNIPPSMGR